jgi:MFS family permease
MRTSDLRRNLNVLIGVSILYGLAFGIYDLALPLYLHSRGFSGMTGGLVYAAPVLACIVVRLWVGPLSDRFGRKAFYGLGIAGGAVSSLLTPVLPWLGAQMALRCLRDACASVRDTLHGVILYEGFRRHFIALLGRIGAAELAAQSVGFLIVGYGTGRLLPGPDGDAVAAGRYTPVLILSGVLLLGATALLKAGFREPPMAPVAARSSFLSEMVRMRLDRRLYAMMLSILIFNVGLGASHTYLMYAFWVDKFGVGRVGMGWLMFVHRVLFALPMFFVGHIVRGRLHRRRRWLMATAFILQGACIAASGLLPTLGAALAVWLLHDLVGAGFWLPIQGELMQRYCSSESRGADSSKALALTQAGLLAGVPLGGWCYGPHAGARVHGLLGTAGPSAPIYGLPFVAGGLLMALAAVPVLGLIGMDPEGSPAARPAAS